MKLFGYELARLLRLKALWGFFVLCLLFNGLLLYENAGLSPYVREAGVLSQSLGTRMDAAFTQALGNRPRTAYQDAIYEIAQAGEDVFASCDLEGLSAHYCQGYLANDPVAAGWMAAKYAALESRRTALSQSGASLALYAGPVSHELHQFLHGRYFRALTAEGAVGGMLGMLYLLHYERLHHTVQTVYVSRSGRRRVLVRKLAAGALGAAGGFLLLAAVSLGAYFLLFDYRGIWASSVSSQFNYLVDLLVQRPFLTWGDFTAAGYFAASLALGTGLCVVFALGAGVLGVWIPNVYHAALTVLLFLVGGTSLQAILAQMGLWTGYFIAGLQPVSTWLSAGGWFTELGLSAFLPWQETVSVLGCLALFAAAGVLAVRAVCRKDVTG